MKPTSDELAERGYAALLDMAQLLFGDFIGRGASRSVYQCAFDETLIVKIDEWSGNNANALEWATWRHLADQPTYSRWLAPCIAISPRGDLLLQRKTSPISTGKEPKMLPAWLCDVKPENFGLLKGKVVCHDYNTLHMLTSREVKMRTAQWRR